MESELQRLQQLLARFQAVPIKQRKGATLLEIARFPHRETVWSNILAFYLDPKREHQLHDLLLKSLFDALESPRKEGLSHLGSVQVETEVPTLAGNRIDVVVTAEHFVLGIENKVLASLYNDLGDYGATLDAYGGGHVPIHKVVLSRYPVAPANGFRNLTYAGLVRAVRANLGAYTDYADAKYLLFFLDFLTTIENHHHSSVLMENPEVVRFLQQNAESVEELVKHHHRLREELVRLLDRVDRALQEPLFGPQGLAAALPAQGALLKGEGGGGRSGRFTYQGQQLLKYTVAAGGATACVQVGVVAGYRLRVHHWAHNNPQMEHLLAAAGLQKLFFPLEAPDEHVAETVLAQVTTMASAMSRARSGEAMSADRA